MSDLKTDAFFDANPGVDRNLLPDDIKARLTKLDQLFDKYEKLEEGDPEESVLETQITEQDGEARACLDLWLSKEPPAPAPAPTPAPAPAPAPAPTPAPDNKTDDEVRPGRYSGTFIGRS